MARYSKLIAAIVGLLVIILTDVLNLTADGTSADALREILLSLLTAFGVYQIPNKEPTP